MNKYEELKDNLTKHDFKFYYFKNHQDLNEFLLEENEKDNSFYFGGSMTLEEMGTYDLLNEKEYNVNWHWKDNEKVNNKTKYDTKVYLTSTNAITMDGKLVNMDGVGNRVASMINGYDKVYVITGVNKIVENVEKGLERIKNIAAPLNAKRLDKKTPCVKTGKCMDCNTEDRICCAEVILHRNPMNSNVIVCLIEEELGY